MFFRIAGVATVGYLLGALGWAWCFAAAGVWSRRLTWLSVGAWGVFGFAAIAVFLPARLHPGAAVVSAANAGAVWRLMIWVVEVSQLVWDRARPVAPHGRYAKWRLPRRRRWR